MRQGWNFAGVWEAIADEHPDYLAQVQGERSYTWSQFDRRADGIASVLLAAGVDRQGKVAQYMYNCPEYIESMFGAFKAGLVPVNTNYRYGEEEIAYIWGDADIEAVVFDAAFAEMCGKLRRRLPGIKSWIVVGDSDAAAWATPYEEAAASARSRVAPGRSGEDLYLLYTGGTTGMPKGVMWNQDQLFRYLESGPGRTHPEIADYGAYVRALTRPGPRALPAPPLMHGAGAWFAMGALLRAGAVVTSIEHSFRAGTVLEEIARHRVTGTMMIGDPFAKPLLEVLDAGFAGDLSKWKVVLSSGAMFSKETKDRLRVHVPHLLIVDELGSSETGSIANSSTADGQSAGTATFRLKAGSCVLDEDGAELQPGVGRVGRLAVSGHVPVGYYKDPEKTAKTFVEVDGRRYVYTGDWVEMVGDGTVRLLGRGSACINTGGEKVFAEEVEEVLKQHPSVLDAVVVGVPDDRFGEAVTAIVQAVSGEEVDSDALVDFVRAHLAGYKCPRHVVAVDSMGRAPNGKIDHAGLKRMAADRLAPAVVREGL